jgi:hypothetical protein
MEDENILQGVIPEVLIGNMGIKICSPFLAVNRMPES